MYSFVQFVPFLGGRDLASFIQYKCCEMIQVISIGDSFLFIAEQCSIVWMHYNLFIHLLVVI